MYEWRVIQPQHTVGGHKPISQDLSNRELSLLLACCGILKSSGKYEERSLRALRRTAQVARKPFPSEGDLQALAGVERRKQQSSAHFGAGIDQGQLQGRRPVHHRQSHPQLLPETALQLVARLQGASGAGHTDGIFAVGGERRDLGG
jgi:hypothetical protein